MEQQPKPSPSPSPSSSQRDLLTHLEAYLSKRDGIDKLLKISRYAVKIILASSSVQLQESTPLTLRLRSFETSVGISRGALCLGAFIQHLNALRGCSSTFTSHHDLILSVVAYGSAGLYYFIQQFVWLCDAGLIIDKKHSKNLRKISTWCYVISSIGSISLTVKELSKIDEEEKCLRGVVCVEEEEKRLSKLREKKVMKRVSVVQDLVDGLMALVDACGGKGRFLPPLVESSAGILSALISIHKIWVSC